MKIDDAKSSIIGEVAEASSPDSALTRHIPPDYLSHQIMEKLTCISLCCANLQSRLLRAYPRCRLKDLATIEGTIQELAALVRVLTKHANDRGKIGDWRMETGVQKAPDLMKLSPRNSPPRTR